ncbi:hypothetical protein EJ997_04895 [Flaviflexus ciconiae]|uniref:Uncharacterized protein n=1 Tax=Flaviflexus ciconiae TaxID=2496867 RepID=A0A3S9PWN0_9ACTO|nr:hypothetical protein EJ997_04895 [Flaviflexus ciconiae]
MATKFWSAKTSEVPEGARRQWRADRALRPPMRSPGPPGLGHPPRASASNRVLDRRDLSP